MTRKHELKNRLKRLREMAQRQQIETGHVSIELQKKIQDTQIKLTAGR
jgi:hypothetical protein